MPSSNHFKERFHYYAFCSSEIHHTVYICRCSCSQAKSLCRYDTVSGDVLKSVLKDSRTQSLTASLTAAYKIDGQMLNSEINARAGTLNLINRHLITCQRTKQLESICLQLLSLQSFHDALHPSASIYDIDDLLHYDVQQCNSKR